MLWPLMMYRMRPTEKRLRKFVGQLFTTWDDDWANYMGSAFRDFKLDLRIPPLATDDELRRLTMPTLVLAADDDVSFPGPKLLARVKNFVPHADTELLANCKHSPPTTDEFRTWLATRVTEFLKRS
jgi:pimeloyl-ACP methyl ester carboxylesterase